MDEPRRPVSAADIAWFDPLFDSLKDGTDGPPFPVSRPGIEAALGPFFRIAEAGPPPASPERRRGLEWLVRAERYPG